MRRLHIDVAVHTTLGERDHMIDLEFILSDELLADAAHATVHLINHIAVDVLNELTFLTSPTPFSILHPA